MSLDSSATADLVARRWRDDIVDQLRRYITIPALSPAFDADWAETGHLDEAVEQVRAWMAARPIRGLTVEVRRPAGRTPLIVAEVAPFAPGREPGPGVGPGTVPDPAGAPTPTVLLYGHLDKQPEMTGWRDGLGPWTPVIEDGRLYGRGGADDGYAAFASCTAIEAVQASGGSHPRLLVLIEASEESGSPVLPAHIEALADRLGRVELVVCLDSGCADYERMWLTTSLRGVCGGSLEVDIVGEGLHSGAVSGLVPSTFRIARGLLDRVEDVATGQVRLTTVDVPIPPHRVEEVTAMAAALGHRPGDGIPLVPGARTTTDDPVEAELAVTWRAALSVVGADGLPPAATAGNVLRPSTTLRLSLRVPPTGDAAAAVAELGRLLEADPPYGARVRFTDGFSADGWDSPALAPWLRHALDTAATEVVGRPVHMMGEGGSIPFMGMLAERSPDAQFVITGVLGPGSNAHGPNEFIDLAYAEKLTRVIAVVLDAAADAGRPVR
ncbi:MAG: M20/M25/M40 family metallo-hydrolase [Acidimicrobiales bacterium]